MILSHLTPVEGGIRGELAMLIAMGESAPNKTTVNYNLHNQKIVDRNSKGKIYARFPSKTANLSNLSLREVMQRQGEGEGRYWAVGRWQIIPSSMVEFAKWLKVGYDTRFTNHLQDLYVVYALLRKRRGVRNYLLSIPGRFGPIYVNSKALELKSGIALKGFEGVPSAEYAACLLAMEWSSKAMPNGSTFYTNGVDKAHVGYRDAVSALEAAKARVAAARSKGVTDEAALIWAALGGAVQGLGAIALDVRRNGEFQKYDSKARRVEDVNVSSRARALSTSTVDNVTASVLSAAHAAQASGKTSPSVSRRSKHKSLITRNEARVVDIKRNNGVTLYIYSDGTIQTEGPVKALKGGYVLSKRSLKHLEGVHPKLVAVVKRAIKITGQDFSVTDGVRTLAEQRAYVAGGKSKTMKSNHLVQSDGYSHAVDLTAYPASYDIKKYFLIADAMSIAARELNTRIRWGGSWSDISDPSFRASMEHSRYVSSKGRQAFVDGPHFELIV